jgi:regulator of sirC expression with transglutaminase-like and TPR domain
MSKERGWETDAVDPLMQIGLLEDDAIPLDEAALALAAVDRPGRAVEPGRARIAELAARLAEVGRDATGAHAQATALVRVIAQEAGIGGDADTYEDPANADLMDVLDRRRGLPVTLAILYTALARRVGWRAMPLNVPGHVLLRVGHEADAVTVDPFDGGRVLDSGGLAALLARILGNHAVPQAEHLAPLSNRATLVRLLNNQAQRARRAGDVDRALLLHERMTSIAPSFTGLWWERARLEQLTGRVTAARASLSAMLETTRDATLEKRIRIALDALARSMN